MIFITNRNRSIFILKNVLIIGFWVLVWQMIYLGINEPLLFASPMETVWALGRIVVRSSSWITLLYSIRKIALGFILAVVLGILFAGAACRYKLVREILAPVMTLLKSIPVASFVVLILAWLSSGNLSVFIAGLVTFPIIYFDMLDCLVHTNPQMLQLTKVFQVRWYKKIRFLYLPSMIARLCNTARISIGTSIRAGVAAELIGLPDRSIGEAIYKAKLYFNVADLFAWTILIVCLCFVCERLVLLLCKKVERGLTGD